MAACLSNSSLLYALISEQCFDRDVVSFKAPLGGANDRMKYNISEKSKC